MRYPNAHLEIVVRDDNGDVIDKVGDEFASWERTIFMKDKFRQLIGDSGARVSISVSERIGGPYGYSSVSVNVTVTLSCDQNVATVREAEQQAFQEAAGFADENIEKAYAMLEAHLEKLVKRS
jgi:hypothetical protein